MGQSVTAVRLEALTHPSLPGNGPGRYPGRDDGQHTGNFALQSWKVAAMSPNRKGPITLEFDHASTYPDAIYPIASQGLWNIVGGGEGRNCTAVWSLSKPVSLAAGTTLTFQMQFQEWDGVGENLGRFRLSASGDSAAFARFAAMQLTDPWAKLAAAYHVIGDRQALDTLLKHHPQAAAGLGDLYAASQDWERAIAEYRKLVTDQRPDVALLTKLATAYQSAGRTREAVPHLAKASAANPKDTMLCQKVAALQAWFGQDKEFGVTRQRILAFAKGTEDSTTCERVAKACSILPCTEKAELEAALALARKGAELGKGRQWQEWNLLALGMAEYRSGNYAAADEALLAAAKAGANNPIVTGISAFYRAMSVFRQGKEAEARKLVIAATARMKPLPKDEQNPFANGAYYDDLILWLAYKEAKALIKFEVAPSSKAKEDKK
jgi:tetratricopeptide (TPR) repeat protein